MAFSDQDDEWLERKLEIGISELGAQGRLSLVHSDLEVVTNEGNLGSAWKLEVRAVKKVDSKSLMLCNSVTGCTVLMDVELARRYPEIPDSFSFHDHWYAVVASLNGGVIGIEQKLVNYRIHDKNVVGVEEYRGVFHIPENRSDSGLITRLRIGSQKVGKMELETNLAIGTRTYNRLFARSRFHAFANSLFAIIGFSKNWFSGNGPLSRAFLGFSLGSLFNCFFGLTTNK